MFALVSGISKPSPEFLAGIDVGVVLNRTIAHKMRHDFHISIP